MICILQRSTTDCPARNLCHLPGTAWVGQTSEIERRQLQIHDKVDVLVLATRQVSVGVTRAFTETSGEGEAETGLAKMSRRACFAEGFES